MNLPNEQSIHLWCVDDQCIVDETLLDNYRQCLSVAEKEQYERFANHSQKHQYLVTRALVRSVFSLYVPKIHPKHWVFDKNQYGKPFITHEDLPSTFSFNISHSKQAIVLAVGFDLDIGVDVEWTKRSGFSLQFAEHYFARNEISEFKKLDEHKQQDRIFDLWTLKEAYIKARGLGLKIPLNSSMYRFFDDKQLTIEFRENKDELDNWNIWLFNLRHEHRLALAVKSHADQNNYSDSFSNRYSIKAFEYTPGRDWKNQELILRHSLNKYLIE